MIFVILSAIRPELTRKAHLGGSAFVARSWSERIMDDARVSIRYHRDAMAREVVVGRDPGGV